MVDDWALDVFQDADLGDMRRRDRLVKLASAALERPEAGLSSMMKGEAENKAAQRFFSNNDFNEYNILLPVFESAISQINNHSRVLLIQDTTHLNYDSKLRTYGLGHIGSNNKGSYQGILLHWTLALDSKGYVLGTPHSKFWCRKKREKPTKVNAIQSIPYHEKESFKWVEAVESIQDEVSKSTQAIWVADREADIYDFIDKVMSVGHDFVIRSQANRIIDGQSELLQDYARNGKLVGSEVLVLNRKINGKKTINVNIRCSEFSLLAQRRKAGAQFTKPCQDRDIYAVHVCSTEKKYPLEWILLTSMPLKTLQDCLEVIWIYKQRWQIELVHKVLKSGYKAEELCVNTASKLKKILAIMLPVSAQVFKLSRLAREKPEEPAENHLSPTEIKLLLLQKGKPKTYVLSMKEAWFWIGLLGGFRGSKNSKPAGAMVFWRGYKHLQAMAAGAELISRS